MVVDVQRDTYCSQFPQNFRTMHTNPLFYGMHTVLPLFLKNVRAKGTVSSKADGEKAILCLYLF